MKKLAIFASGAGSNAAKIIEHFKRNRSITVALVVCNNPHAGVLQVAESNKIPSLLIEKTSFSKTKNTLATLQSANIDFIVLAGFLWKIPSALIHAFPKKIINIHPALLPKFGGKGMYGKHVHEMVLSSGEKASGITIHFVDELYDHGQIILQAKCEVLQEDDLTSLSKKIQQLEHRHYPTTIELLATL